MSIGSLDLILGIDLPYTRFDEAAATVRFKRWVGSSSEGRDLFEKSESSVRVGDRDFLKRLSKVIRGGHRCLRDLVITTSPD